MSAILEYTHRVLKEKGAEVGPEPAIGDFIFDFNGNFIGFLVARDFKNDTHYGTVNLFFDSKKERIIKSSFRNKAKNPDNKPTEDNS